MIYKDFEIEYVYPPIPVRDFDWSYCHIDELGEENVRGGFASTLEKVKKEIDEYWKGEENE